jgi:hypothetical protein
VRRLVACALVVTVVGGAGDARAQPAAFESVVADLASPDAGTRARALRLLESTGYPEAIVPVSALVRDPDRGIRLDAIAATLMLVVERRVRPQRTEGAAASAFREGILPAMRVPPEVFDHMAAGMSDPDPGVRREAVLAFAVLAGAGARTVPDAAMAVAERALVGLLGALESETRVAAAHAAGHLYRRSLDASGVTGARRIPTSVGDALIALVNQPLELERLVAMESLGLAGEVRAVTALADRYQYHRRAGPPLEMAAALDALARLGHPSSLPLFLAAWTDRWDAVRVLGYEGLARTTARAEAVTLLAGRPEERDTTVGLAQAFARARLLADGSVARLIDALRASRSRVQAYGYLLELGPAMTPALIGALQHSDAGVRAAAADLLGRVGTPEAVGALRTLALDRNRAVVAEAALAVRRINAGISLGVPPAR